MTKTEAPDPADSADRTDRADQADASQADQANQADQAADSRADGPRTRGSGARGSGAQALGAARPGAAGGQDGVGRPARAPGTDGTSRMPWTPGTPCRVTLLVEDMKTAHRFYGGLFGWQFPDPPRALPPGRYVPALLDGREVAALALRPAGRRAPSSWITYLASDDVDETAERARHCGGTVGVGPLDARTSGRLAVASDPAGAVFGVWQETDPDAAGARDMPGAPVWAELVTYETARVVPFYRQVFGHEARTDEPSGTGGLAFCLADVPVASVRDLAGAAPGGRGAHWTTYFGTTGVDAAVERVVALGGSVLEAPQDGPRGRIAEVADPEGATFRLVQAEDG